MKRLFKLVVLGLGFSGAVAAGLYYVDHRGAFSLENINIVLLDAKPQHDFLRPLFRQVDEKFETLRGVSILRIPMSEKARELSALPWVERVEISRRFPHQISVEITPKQVFLLSMTETEGLRPVLEDGTILNPIAAEMAPDVIHLRGNNFVEDLSLRKSAIEFVKSLPVEGSLTPTRVAEISYNPKEGFWLQLVKSDLKIKMGHEPFDVKSARASQVLEYIENRKIDVRVMDANFTKKVVVRLRKDP